ncbi:MAG: flagellar motor switch protein FliM [Clostridiaceae bacterium]|nr:flagellar motor switch protein FliM [Clostridiaceae bacterium]
MPEILSQNQIDDLLSELMGGGPQTKIDTPDKHIREYNFKTPKKLSRDQQKVLTGIHEIFARHLAAYLAGLTRSYCEVNVVSIEEHPYYEYNNALPDILVTGIIDVNILKGSLLLDMSDSIAFALIERMFGSNVRSDKTPQRDFTEIELSLMDRVFRKATVFVEEAWAHVPNVSATLRQIETNTRFIKSISMDEVVAVIVFSVLVNGAKGTVTCCVPCMNIDDVLDSLNTYRNTQEPGDENDEEQKQQSIMNSLSESSIEMRGILGKTVIPMGEVVTLQPGDVIRLEQHLDSPVVVTVNGKAWFYGRPGISKNQMAVKIIKP